VHKGEHPAIVDREIFDRVQAMLSERTVARTVKRGNSSHLLTGLIFDDRGNPMSPTHANKNGVRYRYYTSQALLQRRKEHAGSVPRVPAPEIEALICEALRREGSVDENISDRELVVAAHVSNVIIRRDRIDLEISSDADGAEPGSASKLVIPFMPSIPPQKGITREPIGNGHIDAVAREKLLIAIRRACRWVEAVKSGEAKSFDEIAAQEKLAARHIRWLTPLAFLSPNVVSAIMDEAAPAGLTIAALVKALPRSWAEQEHMFRVG
jgi:hypothetical protein